MKAFPHKERLNTTDPNIMNPIYHGGMDLRDYFAANAPIDLVDLDIYWGIHWELCEDKEAAEWLAKARYEYADAMMKAREQK